MTTFTVFGAVLAVLGLSVTVSATFNGCIQEWGASAGITCDNAEGFGNCLRGLSDADKQAAGDSYGGALKAAENKASECQARVKLDACKTTVTCANVQQYLDCLTAIDLTAIPHLKSPTDQNIANYRNYQKQCIGQDAIRTCQQDHVNAEGKLTCDTMGGLVTCLKNIDLTGLANLITFRDNQVAGLEGSLTSCQATNGENEAHVKINNCINVHLPDNTYNCDNVKPFRACLEAADVSAYPAVQTRKDDSIATANRVEAGCFARAKIQTCLDTHSPLTCGNVESYITCLNNADVSADAGASATKANQLTQAQAFFKQCQAAARLNNCIQTHTNNGNITCETLDAYTGCIQNADVAGYADLEKRKADTLTRMAAFKQQCEEQAATQAAQVTEGETAGTAQTELNECGAKFPDGGCGGVAGYLACVQAVDTTGQPDAQTRKEQILRDFGTFQRKCHAYDLINGCTKNNDGTTCAGVGNYLNCLNNIDVSEFEETRTIKANNLARSGKFQRKCQALDKLNACAKSQNGDGVIECNEVAAYLTCLKAVDASEFPELQTEKQTSITKYETQARKCQGIDALNNCATSHSDDKGTVTCGTVDAYLACLNAVNVNEFPTLVTQQTGSRTKFEAFKQTCDGNKEAQEANDKLNACITQHLENGVITCNTVGAYIACLESHDVSNVAAAQQRKTSDLNKAKGTQRHCQIAAQLNACSTNAGKGNPGACENVVAYLACVSAVNANEFQDLATQKTNIINTFTQQKVKCDILAEINECRAKHAPGGSYDCNTVNQYIACMKAIDTSAAATLKTHIDGQVQAAENFEKASCGADSPRQCILTHAPNRRLNCVNSAALKACFDRIGVKEPAAVTRKVLKCQEQKPIYECKMKYAPKNTINCGTGPLLITCLSDLDTSTWKYAHVVRDSLVKQLRALVAKHCGV